MIFFLVPKLYDLFVCFIPKILSKKFQVTDFSPLVCLFLTCLPYIVSKELFPQLLDLMPMQSIFIKYRIISHILTKMDLAADFDSKAMKIISYWQLTYSVASYFFSPLNIVFNYKGNMSLQLGKIIILIVLQCQKNFFVLQLICTLFFYIFHISTDLLSFENCIMFYYIS